MTPPLDSEYELVELPAMQLLHQLGWELATGKDEVFGEGGTLGRQNSREVVLVPRLRVALRKLNREVPPEAIEQAVDELTRDRSTKSLVDANQELWGLLRDGLLVSLPDPEHGGQKKLRLRLVDWDTPQFNDLLAVNQLKVSGVLYNCIPDIVGFVNGLPWVVIELKKPGVPAQRGFDDNLTSYKHPQNGMPPLFVYNALLIASNGTESKVGSLTADWERFSEWKRVEREDEPKRVSLEVMLRGVCEPGRLLDLVENFTLFSRHKAGTIKALAQNHQFLGVNNAIRASMVAHARGSHQGGVFWHTQGSGKSFSMVFYAQKVLRKLPGNWTFVVITDRDDLDDQISGTFKAVGAVSEAESKECQATSGAHLRELLRGNHRYVFTLIQKFGTAEVLNERRDIIVLTDEAHRSQYDTLAMNMRTALPNALFLAFTGTPLLAGEERTREVFGDYVSIYDYQQSAEDGATVPLFYENRTPELKLENPALNEQIYDLIEEAELDEVAEKKLERELGRQYHLITRDDRLNTVARDIVQHFLGRGFQGKAMVVGIDKATAVKMYDKVRRYWQEDLERTQRAIADERRLTNEQRSQRRLNELLARLEVLESTDMAVIVSGGQNEVEEMRKQGLDITPHRKRMVEERMDEKFKDPKDPFRIVFVCAMWLTGFDAPSCSTIYLDKPMRNHTLMQTIARANRVYPGKHSGLIVDYANVFASLEKALAIYTQDKGGKTPVQEKDMLVKELEQALADATSFCNEHGVDISAFTTTERLERLQLVSDAVEAMIAPDATRKTFLAHEKLLDALYKAVKPDKRAAQFANRISAIATIAGAIRAQVGNGTADISGVMAGINALLDESIASEGFVIQDDLGAPLDLSKIDFEALAQKFKSSARKQTDIERLKAQIKARLERMVRLNPTRADYLEKFNELIESYNSGSRNVQQLYEELLRMMKDMSAEEHRHVRENLSEEELTLFDLLTRPGPDLNKQEQEAVKKAARELLMKLKELLSLDWRERNESRARVKLAIEDLLDSGLPRAYTPELYKQKCDKVFQHVFAAYTQRGVSVYGGRV
ncbi:MAG: type I restriction endonuclease subunit R [Flavobacteriales bacterium]|nr:type I restriction endonuclease subunit R [Flavobacteriales bacterium]